MRDRGYSATQLSADGSEPGRVGDRRRRYRHGLSQFALLSSLHQVDSESQSKKVFVPPTNSMESAIWVQAERMGHWKPTFGNSNYECLPCSAVKLRHWGGLRIEFGKTVSTGLCL